MNVAYNNNYTYLCLMKNLQKYKDYLLLRNMSDKTIKCYVGNIVSVSTKIGKEPSEIDENDLVRYLLSDDKRNLSTSSQMLLMNSFKSFFKIIHDRQFDESILPRPKVEQRQPDILSIDEIQRLIDGTLNIKHKTIFLLMYSGALRVSEIINIKIKDIDSQNKKIHIREAKGKIDRFIALSPNLLKAFKTYWSIYKTSEYLFEGSKGGQYSVSSIQSAVRKNVKKVKINKRISTHSFRHSSITHMIKNGNNLRVVQRIAGHKNINTTANYVKIYDEDIMDVENPIEFIKI